VKLSQFSKEKSSANFSASVEKPSTGVWWSLVEGISFWHFRQLE